MKKDFAYAVELPYWQAPNDDLLLKSQGDSLTAFFKIWISPSKYSKFTGIFNFSCVWAVRYERNKELSYYSKRDDDDFVSCYWIVPESSWIEKLKKDALFSLNGKNMMLENIHIILFKVIHFT